MLCLHPIYYKKDLVRLFIDPARPHFNFSLIIVGSGWKYSEPLVVKIMV